MRRLIVATLLSLAFVLVIAGSALAQGAPEFKLGFKTLADQLPADVVGVPAENEYFNLSNGNAEQHTTAGLMVWRKADNWTAFTNGYMTWINGPAGVQSRLNSDRFDWEKDLPAQAPVPQPTPAPQPAPTTAWTVVDKTADGFKISLPPSWQQVDLNSQDFVADFKAIFKDYPNSGDIAQQYAVTAGLIKLTKGVLFAFPVTKEALAIPGGTLAKILKFEVPSGTTMDSLSTQVMTSLDGQVAKGDISNLAHRRVTLPAGQAEQLEYVQRVKMGSFPEITAGAIEYLILHNGYMYDVVFVAMTPSGADQMPQISDGMIKSLQFTN